MGRRLSPPRRSCGSGRPPGRAELAACAASRWPPAPCRAHENRAAGCTCTALAGRRAAPGPMLRPPEQRTRPAPSKAASSGDPSLRSGTVCVKVACECATNAAPTQLAKFRQRSAVNHRTTLRHATNYAFLLPAAVGPAAVRSQCFNVYFCFFLPEVREFIILSAVEYCAELVGYQSAHPARVEIFC